MRPSLLALSLLLVGCVDKGDEGMFVLNNTAPTGDTCTLTGDKAQAFLPLGSIYAGVNSAYVLTPLIQSRVTALSGHELERTIHLEGANIVLSTVGGDGKLTKTDEFTSLFSGSIDPLGTVNVIFPIVPAATVKATTMTTTVNASISVYGTLGGGRIQAEPFNYAVTICTNCLLRDNGPCVATASEPAAPSPMDKGNPCNIFQDYPVDCCHTNNGLICPGPGT